jgi:hypothetical protein
MRARRQEGTHMTCSKDLRAVAVMSLVALAAFAPSALVRGAIPGADKPNAYTYHQFIKADREYNRRTIVEAYKSAGKRDAKWDKEALAALEGLAERFTGANLERLYFGGAKVEDETIARTAEKASGLGCDDPMVLYAWGAMLHDLKRKDQAKPILIKSFAGFESSAYPPERKASAALRLVQFYDADRGAADVAELRRLHEFAERMLELASTREAIGNNQRAMLGALDGLVSLPADARERLLKKIDAASDPWIALMLRGLHHKKAGWDARGRGFAGTVTDEGWKAFGEELAKARDAFVKAHALHPEWPEAASEMIAVAMGGGAAMGEDPRAWFDKAVKAQLDWRVAYNNYVFSIYPRWGGSHMEMFEFGLECAKSGRFDTAVPYQLIAICEKINEDSDHDFTFYEQPQVYAAINDLFERWERKAAAGADLSWYRSYHLALAWRARKWGDTARVMQRVERPDVRAFEKVRGWAPGAMSEVQAMLSDHGATLNDAERSLTGGDYDAAIAGYQQVLAGLAKEDAGALFVRYRSRGLEIERDFRGGKIVLLSPEPDLLPWFAVDGKWSRGNGSSLLLKTVQDARNLLLCKADFGDIYDMGVLIDWPDIEKPAPAALYVRVGDETAYVGLSKDGECWIQGPRGRRGWKGGLPEVSLLLVNYNQGKISIILNTQPLIKDYELRMPPGSKDVYMGVGSPSTEAGLVARFREVRVAMHKEKPPK